MNGFPKNAVAAGGALVVFALAGTTWPCALNLGLQSVRATAR